MSAILEEAIEEVRTLPPEKKKHLRELSEDFADLMNKESIRDLVIMLFLLYLFGKNLDESNLDELRSELEKLSSESSHGVLTEGAVPAQSSDRARELQWIEEHRDEYLGEWVVVEGDSLIVHGHDARTVYDAAREAGIEVPFLIHVQPVDELPFGGW